MQKLPVGWTDTSVGEVFEFAYGKGLVKSSRKVGGQFPVYGSSGVVGYHDEFLVKGPKIVVGRKGAAGSVHLCPENCWPIDTTYFVNPKKEVNVKFAYYFLKNLRLHQFETSTAIPGLNRDDAYRLDFWLPPIKEQHRIVAKIEELFSELDKGIESLKTAREQLKVYRQAVLKHAFEGKLTAQWREENKDKLESPEQLLARIQQERDVRYEQQLHDWQAAVSAWERSEDGSKKPTKPIAPKTLPNLTSNDLDRLGDLPSGWIWVKLGNLSSKITDGEHFRPKVQEQGIYFLSAKDVRDSGVSLDAPLYVDKETALKARLRCDPKKGDILIVSRGATVGRMCVVDTDELFCLLGSVILVKATSCIESLYLCSALKSPAISRAVVSSSGATAQQAIYLRDIQHVAIPVCGELEQLEIVASISQQMSTIDYLYQEIENQQAMSEILRHAILKKAFSGQLVAQDCSDEPSTTILERIRKETSVEMSGKKKRKSIGDQTQSRDN
ncbi:MAG: restriction endonuclease subunit S [Gammaproteobacteria bacterium]|nr:restriction endonuclease subunit S [Gammaproteobacteria bacterium]